VLELVNTEDDNGGRQASMQQSIGAQCWAPRTCLPAASRPAYSCQVTAPSTTTECSAGDISHVTSPVLTI